MAVLKFKNPKYTGLDDEPKYISLPNIFVNKEIFIGDSQPTGNEILWIGTDSSIKFKNGEEWVSIELNSSDTLDLSSLLTSEGDPIETVSDEFLLELKKAYDERYSNCYLLENVMPMLLKHSQVESEEVYFIDVIFPVLKTTNEWDISNYHFAINVATKALTFNSNNINIVQSGSGNKALTDNGKYAEFAKPSDLDSKADKIKVEDGGSGTVTKELQPNILYEFGECASLTITLASEIEGVYSEYMFEFVSGTTPTMLSIPETVGWMGGEAPTIEANKTYQCSIVNNIAVIGGK